MKKNCLILTFLATALSAVGQNLQAELPFLPHRDTNHIRTIRLYSVNEQTGERKQGYTVYYDRRGYPADTNTRNVFDSQGRLTLQEAYKWVSSTANPMPRRVVERRDSIAYAVDGTVKYYKSEHFDKDYNSWVEYLFHSRTTHPRYGLTDLVYLSKWHNDWIDTIRFRREYDSEGHLMREHYDTEEGYERRFFYDASGRLAASRTIYYESWDTLNYNYDSRGKLVTQTGKLYDIDFEADVTVSFRPDGTVRERREHWISYEDPTFSEDDLYRYDHRGVLIYEKTATGIKEYEIEYWE